MGPSNIHARILTGLIFYIHLHECSSCIQQPCHAYEGFREKIYEIQNWVAHTSPWAFFFFLIW